MAVWPAALFILSSACGPPPEPAEGPGGRPLDTPAALTSASWSSPERLDAGERRADHPKIALDDGGNAIAAWQQQVNYPAKIFVSRYDVQEQAWGTPQLLESGGRVIGDGPHLAMNGSGEAFLIWQQRLTEPRRIFVSHYLPGPDRWTEPEAIDSGLDYRVGDPHIAVDDAGNAIAIWWGNPALAKPASLFVRRFSASTGTWGAEQEIDNLSPNTQEPQIAMDRGGNATAVWTQSSYVFASQYRAADDSWGVPQRLSVQWNVYTPRVARDEHGRSIVVWEQDCGDDIFCLYFRRFTPDGGWTAPQVVPGSEGSGSYSLDAPDRLDPGLAIDAYGSAMVVWTQRKTIHRPYSIWASRYSAFTERWSVGPTLLERTHQSAYAPRVAIDAQSNATAVWHQREDVVVDGTPLSVLSVLRNEYTFAARGWAEAQPVEQSPLQAIHPSVARNPAGQGVGVWSQWVDENTSGIFASRAQE